MHAKKIDKRLTDLEFVTKVGMREQCVAVRIFVLIGGS